ncbi:MAG TPA: TetR/AcrR family transcriptional regulator [Herpetosiphonaceae bacterium]
MADPRPETALLARLDLPRVPQQARSRQKRDALLAAAGELFAQRGYAATTADDIAAAAGVSVGTFYSYFRNKRQLFMALFAASIDDIGALGIAEIDFSPAPRLIVRAVIKQAMERDALFSGLRRACMELLPVDEEFAAFHQQFNEWICGQIETAVRRSAAAGIIWPDLDIPATCWLVTVLIDQAWREQPAGEPARVERECDALADLIYRSLFRQP